MPRLEAIAERAGYSTEWRDEWMTCEGCYKAVRTQSVRFGWRPSYVEEYIENGTVVCLTCLAEAPEGYLAEFSGTTKRMKTSLDLEKCGYGQAFADFIQGAPNWNEAHVQRVADILHRIGVEDFIFAGEDNEPQLWVRGREVVRGTYLEAMELEWTIGRAEKALDESAAEETQELNTLMEVAV